MGRNTACYEVTEVDGWLAVAAAGLISGFVGAMGLGGGGMLIIYLTVFAGVEQLRAQGINLLFFIPIAAISVAVYIFKKKIKFKYVLPTAGGGIVGTLAGVVAAGALPGKLLSVIFGGCLLALGVYTIFSRSE